jgi:hypothetical protein
MFVLVPCSACSRHIRREETSCPFCAAPAEPSPAPPRSRYPLGATRLSRSALVLASLAALEGCGKSEVRDAGVDAEQVAAPPYGAPPIPPIEPTPPERADAGIRPNIPRPPYGAPPPPVRDAGKSKGGLPGLDD